MALDKILIGTRIRELRERILEESREEFAKRCDFSDERYVGQLERGGFLPSLESLYKIADATGVSLNDLLIGKRMQINQWWGKICLGLLKIRIQMN